MEYAIIKEKVLDAEMFYGIIGPGDALYTPTGYWTLELSVHNMRGWGVRIPVHTIDEGSSERLAHSVSIHSNSNQHSKQ